jgi:hypothetical protein
MFDIITFKRNARVAPQHTKKHWAATLDSPGLTAAPVLPKRYMMRI